MPDLSLASIRMLAAKAGHPIACQIKIFYGIAYIEKSQSSIPRFGNFIG